jgi:hypothetical protein
LQYGAKHSLQILHEDQIPTKLFVLVEVAIVVMVVVVVVVVDVVVLVIQLTEVLQVVI